MKNNFTLTLSCPDRAGIVHAVSGFLYDQGCNILDSDQFGDFASEAFFMRVHFTGEGIVLNELHEGFQQVAQRFSMTYGFNDLNAKLRTVILVSHEGHCLNDLLFRESIDSLPIDTVAVYGNTDKLRNIAENFGKDFGLFEVGDDYPAQERRLREAIVAHDPDLVVLARYMRILTPDTCRIFSGRLINIHHSFLPSFKGAKPYHRAYETGVKLIGATAHYVTPELDEGPIIEQEVERVDHSMDPQHLRKVGRDLECQTLYRAVLWHSERRVLVNKNRTVVFR